jgi:hypothetical protein
MLNTVTELIGEAEQSTAVPMKDCAAVGVPAMPLYPPVTVSVIEPAEDAVQTKPTLL